jgi:hypothetical protein
MFPTNDPRHLKPGDSSLENRAIRQVNGADCGIFQASAQIEK